MEFEQRLERAIRRGKNRGDAREREKRTAAMNAEELKRLHSEYRLTLSDHIEKCTQKLANHFPGFRFETIFGDRGWGAACYRDDVGRGSKGGRDNFYSRVEMTVRPFNDYHVLDLAAKGTIRNKEVFSRNHFEELSDADIDQFVELIDIWVLEYAELFSAAD